MKAIGLTCGIGSMLLGARRAGFDVVGNVEWRNYYRHQDGAGRNTFNVNFERPIFSRPDAMTPVWRKYFTDADMALGHPECGNFSALNFSNPGREANLRDPADIPLFLELVNRFRPRFFLMDDLPRSFLAVPMERYAMELADYDLFPEWVSNYHYGNIQLNRRRMFMVGALKTERFAFRAGEETHERTVRDVIGDLFGREDEVENHHVHTLRNPCGRVADHYHYGYRGTWADFKKVFENWPEGPPLQYQAADGNTKVRPGTAKVRWEGHAFVMDGGSPAVHPLRNLPLSIRERARIQGFPDDFVFFGEVMEPDGTWDFQRNNRLVKQTGKAMPVQFCEYVARQVRAHIDKKIFVSSGERLVEPNPLVDGAKRWYCENVGYAAQDKACAECWMRGTCTLDRCVYKNERPEPRQARQSQRRVLSSTVKVVSVDPLTGRVFGSFGSED